MIPCYSLSVWHWVLNITGCDPGKRPNPERVFFFTSLFKTHFYAMCDQTEQERGSWLAENSRLR